MKKKQKQITVQFFQQRHLRPDWQYDYHDLKFDMFFDELGHELARFGIELQRVDQPEHCIEVNSYADVLNAIRVVSPADGITGMCVGHIIGRSPNRDVTEDLRRAVNRVAFAPETIEPDAASKRVCHNCGCGC